MYPSKLDLLTDTTVCVSETSISGELKENFIKFGQKIERKY